MSASKIRPSIQDVSRLAGVSLGTVSNVLNNPEMVKPATAAKVQRAIDQLGFVRNDAARLLKAGKSKTLGLVVFDAGNPFFAELARGAEDEAASKTYAVLLGNSDNKPERERAYLQLFDEQRVAGVLISPTQDIYEQIRELRSHGTQTVVVDRKADADRCCSVSVDDFAGGKIAVEHLVEMGRRKISFVGGPVSIQQVADRLAGALAAVSSSGGAAQLSVLESASMSVLAGREVGESIAKMPKSERPDAIFAANDLLAMGLVQAFMFNNEISIPAEIALIGYDDIDFAESAVVPLTSIRQPARLIGSTAIELVIDEIENQTDHSHQQITFQPELVVRASTTF
ncbi:MAG: LacI family DNA-binding transcriptional regulator [Micrococcales bacterium]